MPLAGSGVVDFLGVDGLHKPLDITVEGDPRAARCEGRRSAARVRTGRRGKSVQIRREPVAVTGDDRR